MEKTRLFIYTGAMEKKVHRSSILFLLAGFLMAVSAMIIDITGALNQGQTDPYLFLRLLAIPGLYAIFSAIAFLTRKRGVFSFLRFLMFFVVLGNFLHLGFTGLMHAGVLDKVSRALGEDMNYLFMVLDAAPRMGIHSFFALTGWYPLYAPGNAFTPFIANAVSVSVLSWIFGRYAAAAKKKNESAEEPERAQEPAAATRAAAPSLSLREPEEDLIDRLYRKMMEQEEAAKVAAVSGSSAPVETQFTVQDAAYEEPRFHRRRSSASQYRGAEGNLPWVLCTESPEAAADVQRLLSVAAGEKFYRLGEGTVLVQERLNVYGGLKELDKLLPENARGTEATAVPFSCPSGSPAMLLFAE